VTVGADTWTLYIFDDPARRDGWLTLDRSLNGVAAFGDGYALVAPRSMSHADQVAAAQHIAAALHGRVIA
jgi:hypothetical protein